MVAAVGSTAVVVETAAVAAEIRVREISTRRLDYPALLPLF